MGPIAPGTIGACLTAKERRRAPRGPKGETTPLSDVQASPPSGLRALQPVLETALDAVVVMGDDGTVLDWNAHAEQVFGWTREEAVGRDMADLIIPERMRAAHRAGLRRVLAGGSPRILRRMIEISTLRRDGSEIPVELTVTRPQLAEGPVFLGFIRDISVRKRNEMALRNAERRLRATQDHADVGIAEVDATGRYLRANPAFCEISGLTEQELLRLTFLELTHPDERAKDGRLFAEQIVGARESYTIEKRYLRSDGREVWVSVAASPVRDDDGRFQFGVRVAQDITARRAAEHRQKLLMDELNHRVKNTLAIVLSIASQTSRHVADLDAFRRVFPARIQALAKAHELLTRERWEGAPLRDLLEAELALHALGPGQIQLSGPAVWLNARSAVDIGLIVHELATNAAKHGALSAGGTVEASWSLLGAEDERRIRLCWRERGGPSVRAPARKGFGSKLINALVHDNLGGEAVWRFEPEGLGAEISFPASPPGSRAAVGPNPDAPAEG
jgi:PAS domain S-box-containing protein